MFSEDFSVEYTEDGEFFICLQKMKAEIYPQSVLEAIVYSFRDCRSKAAALALNECVDSVSVKAIREIDNHKAKLIVLENLSRQTGLSTDKLLSIAKQLKGVV